MMESTITRQIMSYLRSLPDAWVRKNHGSEYQRRGIPDIECIHLGKIYFFEVKQPGQSMTLMQALECDNLRKAGATFAGRVTDVSEVRIVIEESDHASVGT